MLILIKIEEYFRNRKIKNRQKVFNEIQKVLRKINHDGNESDGTIMALASACNYDTLKFTLDRAIIACRQGIKIEAKNINAVRYYKRALSFFGFLKFVLEYNGGYLGFLWV